MNAWNIEILENLLPQFIQYEPECINFKQCITNIKNEFDNIVNFIANGMYAHGNAAYKEHKLKYIRLLRKITTNKIDNCRNKFNFLDKIEDNIDKILGSSNLRLGENMLLNGAYMDSTFIDHIDRKPPTTKGQRLITDYYKSKPKSSSKSK